MTTSAPTAQLDLDRMTEEVYEVNQANGWFESVRTLGDDVALLHSEVAEMLEAYRRWGLDDATPIVGPNMDKPEGVGSEAADVLIRVLDTVKRRYVVPEALLSPVPAVDLGESFGDQITLLHRAVDKVYLPGEDITWPLAQLVARLLRLCAAWNIDLQAEYARKVAYNATRGHRHGGKRL